MNLLAAFDKFKDNMSAECACTHALRGAQLALGADHVYQAAPLTDGGEGFCRILTAAVGGTLSGIPVCGPLGEAIEAPIGWVNSSDLPAAARACLGIDSGKRIAVIEMATAAGLEQVPGPQRHPARTTTRGVGLLVVAARSEGVDAILMGVGGSATSDLGLGALQALGLVCRDAAGRPINPIRPQDWSRLHTIESRIAHLPPIWIACDVDNPLTGPRGAAAVYGPQKGLRADEIESFDQAAGVVAERLCKACEQPSDRVSVPGSGAAGGIAFGFITACGATLVPGFELVAHWLDLPAKLAEADLVMTGEGRFDCSSLDGKGPGSVARASLRLGKALVVLAGAVEPGAAAALIARDPGARICSIEPEGMPLEEALRKGPENIERCAERVLREIARR